MIAGKSVSLCMVIYNQSELVEKAIESVKDIVDEIVIIDQGSSADHAEKLKSLSTQYLRTTNKGNADYDRQYCYAMASKDYILAMDADETVPNETKEEIGKLITEYDFDIAWFLFNNTMTWKEQTVNLEKFLGGDPHPRMWKREIQVGDQKVMPLKWTAVAHAYPDMISSRQVFCSKKYNHARQLRGMIATHLKRGRNIDPAGVENEKNFVRAMLNEFGNDAKREMVKEFPELQNYLRG